MGKFAYRHLTLKGEEITTFKGKDTVVIVEAVEAVGKLQIIAEGCIVILPAEAIMVTIVWSDLYEVQIISRAKQLMTFNSVLHHCAVYGQHVSLTDCTLAESTIVANELNVAGGRQRMAQFILGGGNLCLKEICLHGCEVTGVTKRAELLRLLGYFCNFDFVAEELTVGWSLFKDCAPAVRADVTIRLEDLVGWDEAEPES